MGKRELINALIANIDGGKAVAAAYLGLSESAFNDRLYENKGCKFFTVDNLLALQELSKTALVAEFFAKQVNHIVVEIPSTDELDTVELFNLSLNTQVQRGEVDKLLKYAIRDGVIDENEANQILIVHSTHLAARDKEVKSTIRLWAGNSK